MKNLIRNTAEKWHFAMEKVMPDSFIFAVLLTFIVFILALLVVQAPPTKIVESWYRGFWAYLGFSMQMVVLLIFGYSLAISRLGVKVIDSITGIAKTPAQAVAVVTAFAAVLGALNWGLGLIAGIFLCIGAARRVKGIHWPLLVASAYIGAMSTITWSVSITEPLLMNSPGWGWSPDIIPSIEKEIGQKLDPMGFDQTIYATASIVGLILTPILAVLICYLMHPTPEKSRPISPEALEKLAVESQFKVERPSKMALADKLNWSRTLWILVCVMAFASMVLWFQKKSFLQLDLNMFNFIFIGIAMLLHGNLARFVESVRIASKASFGIILQFPFYAGIFGIMAYTGLLKVIAGWFVAISPPFLFPLITMISSGIINLFIPSSGGIWMVQGPIMILAASKLGVALNRVVMAFTAGEVLTNIIQPFWALPLLGATGTEMRNIMGYCMLATSFLFVLVALIYLFLPM
jgi:short-chain fatty acids transporter